MSNENANLTKVIVPCRFSYLHCWEPNAVSDGDPKYSVSAIIPKSDTETIEKIKRAIEQAKKDSVSKWGGKVPANLKLPLRDGDIDVAAHLFWLQINLIDCHRINRYNDISIEKEKVPEHLFFCRDKCSGTIYKHGYYIKIRNRIQ